MNNLNCMAQAKVTILGAGLTVKNAPIGFNAGTVALLAIRANRSAPHITYGISSFFDADKNNGSLVVGGVATDWFYIPDESFTALQLKNLSGEGYKLDLKIKGVLVASGKADIEATLINRVGTPNKIIDAYEIKCSGVQVSETMVRGELRIMPGARESLAECQS